MRPTWHERVATPSCFGSSGAVGAHTTAGLVPRGVMKNVYVAAIVLSGALCLGQPAAARQSAPPPRHVLGLSGLDDLRIGRAIPRGSSWRVRGAQEGEGCVAVTSPRYPGVYGMVVGGRVRRVTVGRRSPVKLAEGVGVGSTEKTVRSWFGGFRAEPHKYVAAPGKYLTAPNAHSGGPALRFEIGRDRRVSAIHVGTMPELGYVEGCA